MLPVTDAAELEGTCESLALLFDRRQVFYRHTGMAGAATAAAIAGARGAELLSVVSEEEWRAHVGFADWVRVSSTAQQNLLPDAWYLWEARTCGFHGE